MPFDLSQVSLLPYKPWRYTTQPTYNPDGSEATPGVKQELDGVFLLLSRELVDRLKSKLTAAQQTELESFVYPMTEAQAGEWHVPVWARGPDEPVPDPAAVYVRVPAVLWSNPNNQPPAKIKTFMQHLWSAANV